MELKNKPKVVYSLIVLVVVIWVSIFFRIFTFDNSSSDAYVPYKRVVSKSKNKSEKPHFELLLNYADPFVGNSRSQSAADDQYSDNSNSYNNATDDYSLASRAQANSVGALNSNPKQPDKSEEMTPEILYVGMVNNTSKNKNVAILKIDKKKCILCEGEMYQKIEILSITKDSLIVLFAKKKVTYKKK